jgi:MerR family transcriptional regulator/heat shock protein HspR
VDQDLYFISVAARMLGMHPQTLRKYDRLGLIQPSRTIGSMRVYSQDEIERLRAIKRLVDDAGINLAGVQRLLSIAHEANDMPVHDETSSPRSPVTAWTHATAARGSAQAVLLPSGPLHAKARRPRQHAKGSHPDAK